MNDTTRTQITRRIASASGHLKGVERMVQEDSYCIDVNQSNSGSAICPEQSQCHDVGKPSTHLRQCRHSWRQS